MYVFCNLIFSLHCNSLEAANIFSIHYIYLKTLVTRRQHIAKLVHVFMIVILLMIRFKINK